MKLPITLYAKDIAGRQIKLPVSIRGHRIVANLLDRNRLQIFSDVPLPIGGKFGIQYNGDEGDLRADGRVSRNIRDGERRSSIVVVEKHEFVPAPEAIEQETDLSNEHPFSLTTKELVISALILKGWPNREIARKLGITPNTIRHHSVNVYAKIRTADPSIEVNSHLELVIFAASAAGRDLRRASNAALARWEQEGQEG